MRERGSGVRTTAGSVLGTEPELDPVREAAALARVRSAVLGTPQAVSMGRYRVLDLIGSGSMGIVYKAYDPELDRAVAIKLMSRSGRGAIGDRLMAEARAIAKLSHPNVVSVYDVGTTAMGGVDPVVFVVMELVIGHNLERWLAAAPRSWREVLDVFLAAGAGLSAAHRQGLVHRDVKPANILVGADGRARLADFGLAITGDPEGSTAGSSSDSMRDIPATSATQTHHRVGTPIYMAPEQHRGHPADPSTDQYGFCLSLWEALCRAHPYSGISSDALLEAKRRGPPTPPPGADMPKWLRRVLQRGLQPRQSDRYPSMDALLSALHARNRWRRWGAMAAGGLGAVAIAAGVGMGSDELRSACSDADAALGADWNPQSEQRVRERLLQSETPAWTGRTEATIEALHVYAEQWRTANAELCQATRDHAVSAETAALWSQCLEHRRQDLAATVKLLESADELLAGRSKGIILDLLDPASCADLSGSTEGNEALGAATLEVDRLAQRGRLVLSAGHVRQALEYAEQAVLLASDIADPTLRARAHLLLCEVRFERLELDESEEQCAAALFEAERARRPELATHALIQLVALNDEQRDFDRADLLLGLFEAKLTTYEASGHFKAGAALVVALLRAHEAAAGRDIPEAELQARFDEALRINAEVGGPRSKLVAQVLHAQAAFESHRGDLQRAIALQREAVGIMREAYGPTAPDLGSAINNLAWHELSVGALHEARAHAQEALEVKLAVYGADAPRLATTYSVFGQIEVKLGRIEEGLAMLRRAVEIRVTAEDRQASLARIELGIALRHVGDRDAARVEAAAGLADLLGQPNLDLELLSAVRVEVGRLELLVGRVDVAERLLRDALMNLAPGGSLRGKAMTLQGELLLAKGEPFAAVGAFRDAIEALRAVQNDPVDLAWAEFGLAKALRVTRHPGAEAQAQVALALATVLAERTDAPTVAVTTWLREPG